MHGTKRAFSKTFRKLGTSRSLTVNFFCAMKHAGKDYDNNLLVPQPQKKVCQRYLECYKDIFPCFGNSKKWKGMTRQYIKSKSHFENLKVTQKPLSSFCITADLDITVVTKAETDEPTDNNIESIVVKCRPFLKVFQSYIS